MIKRFQVNNATFVVEHTGKGQFNYTVTGPGGFTEDFGSAPNAHKDVLLTALDEAARSGHIDTVTANWPEAEIVEIPA